LEKEGRGETSLRSVSSDFYFDYKLQLNCVVFQVATFLLGLLPISQERFLAPLCSCRQPAAEKPCCSGKKKTVDSAQTNAPAPQQQQKQPAGLSTFEFGG